MSQVTVEIGGRSFEVVCQEGEEEYLKAAAGMLNAEAQKLDQSGGRITESRMLLMSGLLLADRTAAMEEQVKGLDLSASAVGRVAEAEANLRSAEVEIATMQARVADLEDQLSRSSQNAAPMDASSAGLVTERDIARQERDEAYLALQDMVAKVEVLANS